MSLLRKTIDSITPQDAEWRAKAEERLCKLTMPQWALGRLMDLAIDLAGITRSLNPPVRERTIVVMAGDHGVAAEGVSKYPQEVTLQMLANFAAGGAGVNALCRTCGDRVVVVDMGVAGDTSEMVASGQVLARRIGSGTDNMAVGPAMSREDAVRSIEAGIEIAYELASSTDIFGAGEMGIANTTPSSAIIATLDSSNAVAVAGRGTGLDDDQLRRKIEVIERSLATNRPDREDGLDILSKVGGFEIGGIAGLMLGAASLRKPMLVDGFISTAGALIACKLAPSAADYLIAAHSSAEQGHQIALRLLGKEPLLDLGLRLGEGTGAALAMNLVDAAARVLTEVATFEDAQVSEAVR